MPHHQHWKQRGVKVDARSKQQIRSLAAHVRRLVSASDEKPLDLIELLENRLQKIELELFFLDSSEMGSAEASTDPDNLKMYIRSDVYYALAQDDGRARFTIAHEIGHLVMHENIALARDLIPPKPYEDSEWQADCFAAELLVPLHVAARYTDAHILASDMKVSLSCAANRIAEARKQKSQP